MFLDFWKLRDQPFGVTPDPRYLYFSPGHREALAGLFYGIETGRGFLSLIAPPGMGKTTLLFQLLRRWKGYVHSAFLFQTQCDSRELIRYLLEDLGLKYDTEDVVRMHSELNDFLIRETQAGRRVVVFIDEAQNLSDSVLETVRLLTNFEAPEKKLLQIVLAGQPELAQRLAQPSLAQLRQRIAVQTRLDPLAPAEVANYIRHRLQVAGYHGPEVFTQGALGVISELSRGIPRLINILCFNTMSLGFATRCEQIDSQLVREAAKDLELNRPHSFPAPTEPRVQLRPAALAASPWGSLWSRMKEEFSKRRLVHISALSLLLVAVTALVGLRSRSVAAHPSVPSTVNSSSQAMTGQPPSQAARAQIPALPASEPARAGAIGDVSGSFAYVVQSNDTIRDLCLSTVGRYDAEVLAEIRRLNPALKSLNHLEAGQEIRLPNSFPKKSRSGASSH